MELLRMGMDPTKPFQLVFSCYGKGIGQFPHSPIKHSTFPTNSLCITIHDHKPTGYKLVFPSIGWALWRKKKSKKEKEFRTEVVHSNTSSIKIDLSRLILVALEKEVEIFDRGKVELQVELTSVNVDVSAPGYSLWVLCREHHRLPWGFPEQPMPIPIKTHTCIYRHRFSWVQVVGSWKPAGTTTCTGVCL